MVSSSCLLYSAATSSLKTTNSSLPELRAAAAASLRHLPQRNGPSVSTTMVKITEIHYGQVERRQTRKEGGIHRKSIFRRPGPWIRTRRDTSMRFRCESTSRAESAARLQSTKIMIQPFPCNNLRPEPEESGIVQHGTFFFFNLKESP